MDFNDPRISLVYCLLIEILRKKLGLYVSIYGMYEGLVALEEVHYGLET